MTLADAIAKAHVLNEQKIAAGVPRVSEQLSAEELEHLAPFTRFCSFNGLRSCPASPPVIAAFIKAENRLGTEPHKIAMTLGAIERIHDFHSLPNPVATSCVRTEAKTILSSAGQKLRSFEIEAPRSWPKAEQLMFAGLPPEIRAIIAHRERDRETVMRRAQNIAAEAKRQAKKPATTEETKSVDQKAK